MALIDANQLPQLGQGNRMVQLTPFEWNSILFPSLFMGKFLKFCTTIGATSILRTFNWKPFGMRWHFRSLLLKYYFWCNASVMAYAATTTTATAALSFGEYFFLFLFLLATLNTA